MLSDCIEGVCGAAKGGQAEEGEGVKERRLRRDRPFQCQFTEIPAVKNERGKVRVLPIFFPDLLV